MPGDRVQDASVFQITGINYAGPILLREYQKAWICLFTCAMYRCVHLELVTPLTTDTFLQAFHRFDAIRGKPSIIYTDNGTNFVGACNALASIAFNEVSRQGTDERIFWKFIPPEAPGWLVGTSNRDDKESIKKNPWTILSQLLRDVHSFV
ncbi:hypothetical protein AVEN_11712-1 [Araneus ventricosus]|uniref:Integrase catalytic domain-containing protein n=1 Tax=Araneus ventricosus TaxID=182803 RepID=A0A4Y2TCL1_ARAVE|nr:hypothetical protein AVEN_11712-1 [Araneus ventricosus]